MDTEKLKEKVDAAKESVKDLEEPLKSKAFEMILSKLLNEKPIITTQNSEVVNYSEKPYEEDIADKLTDIIDSTSYPLMYKLNRALDLALYILYIAKNEHDEDGLTPSQVSKILSIKFRIPASPNSISMALMKAGNLVDRRTVNTMGGAAYKYRIMHAGEEYLKNLEQNPNKVTIHPPKRKNVKIVAHKNEQPKKVKEGLKQRVSELINEGFLAQPKEVREIREELATRGYPYNIDPIRTALFRLVRSKAIRRIKDIKDGQAIYKYCNI
ncbi:MAG: hypothetical protein PHT54_01900 [Candidatus Nanoarchaeia archaeon]|nr:hypothetical protein [Candidatus Nanoarchaeia archaeon]